MTDFVLPPPCDLGAPPHYDAWRHHQDRLVLAVAEAPTRFVVLAAPTGVGKSLIGVCSALLAGTRWVYLTADRALQNQVRDDFESIGLYDVRGMSNYPCLALMGEQPIFPMEAMQWQAGNLRAEPWPGCDVGPCLDGLPCRLQGGGCHAFDRFRAAKATPAVISNYPFWLQHRAKGTLGDRDLLLMDEAHALPEELAAHLRVEISDWEMSSVLKARWPTQANRMAMRTWSEWALRFVPQIERRLESGGARGREGRKLRTMQDKLEKLQTAGEDWLPQKTDSGWQWDPIWPREYAGMLWGGAKKIVLASATIRPKTLELLGLKPSDYTWVEAPSPFPVERRRVYHIPNSPRIKVGAKASREEMVRLVREGIDPIIEARLEGYKGLCHTVSYKLAQHIREFSRCADLMIFPDSRNTRDVVRYFKEASGPLMLVSPAITTGYDFPYEAADYQIIAKINFPDSRNPIIAARTQEDPSYPMYLAMTSLVQACGRINRAIDDWGETFIIDDNFDWFYWRNAVMAPAYFQESVSKWKHRNQLPLPPAKKIA